MYSHWEILRLTSMNLLTRFQFISPLGAVKSLYLSRAACKMKSTEVQTLGELRMRGTTN